MWAHVQTMRKTSTSSKRRKGRGSIARSSHRKPGTAIASMELPNAIRSLTHVVDEHLESIACALIMVRGKSDQGPRLRDHTVGYALDLHETIHHCL
jgi:hypothetical protein